MNLDVVRTWQDKVDDFVNVRDFGVTGTGNQDDTEALQRAIDQIYNKKWTSVATLTKRVLRLNAGIYRIDGAIRIPPYARIEGEGKDSVRFILTNDTSKFKLATSRGTESNIENDSAEYPAGVFIKSVTFVGLTDSELFSANGVTGITFEDVKFSGSRFDPPIDIGRSGAGVSIKSSLKVAKNISFNNCTFENMTYAVLADSTVGTQNISFNQCKFDNLFMGININNNGVVPTESVKSIGCYFENIARYAMYGAAGVRGIVSLGNTYKNVGSNFEGDTDLPVSDWYPILVFQSHGNYSIADIFNRTLSNSIAYPRISSDGFDTVSMSVDESFSLGNSRYTAGRRVVVRTGTTGFAILNNFRHGTINYTITRGVHVRNGFFKVIGSLDDSPSILFDDDYHESSDVGVNLGLVKASGKIRLTWAVSDLGSDVVIIYDTKTLQ